METRTSPADLDFAAVFAALPHATAVFAADSPGFTVLAASDAFVALAQRPRANVVGRPLASALPNATSEEPNAGGLSALGRSVAAAIQTGAPQRMERYRYDLPLSDSSQGPRFWDAVNIPVRGPDGAVRYVLHQSDDVTAQVREAAAAAQAERRAEGILERMGDAHCVLDREFRIVSVNAATERVLGVPRERLLGRSHWEAFPASADAPVGKAFRRVVVEGVEQHLTHHYTGEGYDLYLELDAYPTEDGGLALFWRDVTQRVRAQEETRASEEKYRALFNQMDEAYAVVEVMQDAEGRWADFLFLEVNPAFIWHTGLPHPMGRTGAELLGTPNPRWAELYGRAAETGESIRLEESELTLGRVFDLNIFRLGGPGSRRIAVLFTDITERRLTEDALRESERRFRLLFENMGEGFALAEMIWDEQGNAESWRYLEVNDAWAQTGVPVSQTIGKTAREVNPEIEPYWIETYARVVQSGEPVAYRNYAKGFGKWFDTVAFKHSENQFGLIFRDATERVRTEVALRLAADAAAYRFALTDALRAATDPTAAQAASVRILGDYLGATRVLYGEADPGSTETFTHRGEYRRDAAMPSSLGPHRWDALGAHVATSMRAGRTLVVDEVRAHRGHSAEDLASYEAAGIRAYLVVPLVRDGRVVAYLAVNHTTPHAWSAEEVALVEETAERTWAAVERVRAEAALRASEIRYRTLFESIDEGFLVAEVLYGAEGDAVDALYLEGNPAASRLTGVPDYSRRRLRDAMPGAEPYWLEVYDRVVRTGVAERLERYVAPHDHWYDFHISRVAEGGLADAQQAPPRVAIVFQDVTVRKRSEEALREKEERLRRAVSIPTVGVLFYQLDGTILDTNAAFERMTGYTLEELRALPDWSMLSPPEFADVTARAVHEVTELGRTAPYEKQWIRKDGSVMWGLFAPTRLAGVGRQAECVEFVIDITRAKEAEEVRQHVEAALRVSLSEREELIRELHHRVKNNLQVITSLLEMQARQVSDARALSLLTEARNRVSAIGTIHELLYQSPSLSRVGLLHYAEQLLPHVMALYEKSATVEIAVRGDEVTVDLARAVPIGLLLNELVSNVCKHAFPGKATGELTVSLHQDGSRMHLRVTDTGVGLPAGFRARDSKTLGLQLVHMLAKQLGGTVAFQDTGGTTADVFLPC